MEEVVVNNSVAASSIYFSENDWMALFTRRNEMYPSSSYTMPTFLGSWMSVGLSVQRPRSIVWISCLLIHRKMSDWCQMTTIQCKTSLRLSNWRSRWRSLGMFFAQTLIVICFAVHCSSAIGTECGQKSLRNTSISVSHVLVPMASGGGTIGIYLK